MCNLVFIKVMVSLFYHFEFFSHLRVHMSKSLCVYMLTFVGYHFWHSYITKRLYVDASCTIAFEHSLVCLPYSS